MYLLFLLLIRHNLLSPQTRHTATYVTTYCGRIELRRKKFSFSVSAAQPCHVQSILSSSWTKSDCLSLLLIISPNHQSMTWGFRVSEDSYCDILSYDTLYHARVKGTVFPYGCIHKYT